MPSWITTVSPGSAFVAASEIVRTWASGGRPESSLGATCHVRGVITGTRVPASTFDWTGGSDASPRSAHATAATAAAKTAAVLTLAQKIIGIVPFSIPAIRDNRSASRSSLPPTVLPQGMRTTTIPRPR